MNEALRARPTDICMSDSMPFQQRWQYRTTMPLKDILHDRFFLPLRQNLRAGDEITLCRYDGVDQSHRSISLLEIATVRVIRCDPTSESVPIALVADALMIAGKAEAPGLEVKRGQAGKFRVVRGDTVIEEFGSKAEAEAALARLAA